jgi:hypothetical protein
MPAQMSHAERPSKPPSAVTRDAQSPPAPPSGPPASATVRNESGEPPIARPAPQQVFCAFVHEVLGQSHKDTLSARKEDKLIQEGVTKLRLSPVLARQIVHAVATERKLQIQSLAAADSATNADRETVETSALDLFMDRAAAILAQHRGLNAKSRVLMSVAGEELGMSVAQINAAVAMFQAASDAEHAADDPQQQRLAALRDYLRGELAAGQVGILTARSQQKYLAAAEQLHGVDTETAWRCLREIAAEHGVRLIADQQAAEHIAELVRQLLGEATHLDDTIRTRIFAEGSQWGLAPMQVDKIIRQRIRDNRRGFASPKPRILAMIGVGVTVVLLLSGLGLWHAASRSLAPDKTATIATADTHNPSHTPQDAIERPRGDEWWARDADLLIAITKARIASPALKGVLIGMNLPDPAARGASYEELVRMAAAQTNHAELGVVLADLLAGVYASEPADPAAARLLAAMLALVPPANAKLPRTADAIARAYWAIGVAVTMFGRRELPETRADELAAALGRALDVPIDRRAEPAQREAQCLAALSRHCFRVVIRGAAAEPLVAAPLFAAVSEAAVGHLDLASREQFAAEFLAEILPAAGDDWPMHRELIARTIDSANPLVVLRLVETMEDSRPPELQRFLADRLRVRAGASPDVRTVAAVAEAVREALGAKFVVTDRRRRQQFERAIQIVHDETTLPADEPRRTFQQTLRLAHAATLTCALARGETGAATFDELYREGPVTLAMPSVSRSGTSPPLVSERAPSNTMMQNVVRYIQLLSDPRRQLIHREGYLRGLAALTESVPDVPASSAAELAAYLVKPKPAEEFQAVLEHAPPLRRWMHARLALADAMESAPIPQERAEQLVSALLGRPVAAGLAGEAWRQRLAVELLRDVKDELAVQVAPTTNQSGLYDDAQAALRDCYATQARLLGMPVEQYAAAATPSASLHMLIAHKLAELSRRGLAAAQSQRLNALLRERKLVDFVSENDVQRTVLLQRLWLRTLAFETALLTPHLAEPAEQITGAVNEFDRQAKNVIQQLQRGENALLDMWQLRLPAR